MAASGRQHTSNQDEYETVTVEHVLEILQHGVIQEQHGLLGWGSNHSYLVSVVAADNALEIPAVYKPQRGERPLWDFPDGTLCYREVAAYQVSQALGWLVVPPTVLRRDAPKGLGSLQFFVHHDPSVNYFSLNVELRHRLMQFAAFDVIINNADRKGGHFLLDERGHLWGIDHGLTFSVVSKLRTVLWDFAGSPIPDDILSDVARLHDQLEPGAGVHCALEALLSPQEIEMTRVRARRLLARKRFPQPGSGPNYPWPPI